VITKRNLDEIAGDSGSREWQSRPAAGRGKLKAAWLADAIAKLDKKKLEETQDEKKTAKKSASKKKLKV